MAQFTCIPRLSDGCICGTVDQAGIVDDDTVVAIIADELLHKGFISLDERDVLVSCDEVYREQQRHHVLRPRRSSKTLRPPQRPGSRRSHARHTKKSSRRKKHASSSKTTSAEGAKALRDIENSDPITLEPLREPIFTFQHTAAGSSVAVRYNVESLVEYMLCTGNFTEPTTRLPFSFEQLSALDTMAIEANLQCDSLVEAKEKVDHYKQLKHRRDMIEGLERCLGEVLVSMTDATEEAVHDDDDDDDDDDDALVFLCTKFHEFDFYYNDLRIADTAFAKQCLMQYIELVKGPPKRPFELTRERAVILDFLREKLKD